jgi:hypothetical protein
MLHALPRSLAYLLFSATGRRVHVSIESKVEPAYSRYDNYFCTMVWHYTQVPPAASGPVP